MKLFWNTLLCLSIVAITANAAISPAQLSPTFQKFAKERKLVVAMPNFNDSIFYNKKNGEPKGLEVANARMVAKALDAKLIFNREATTFDEVPDLVAAHKADVAICDLSRTLPRAKKVLYTNPYITMHHALLVNRLWEAQQNKDDLKRENAAELLQKKPLELGVRYGTSFIYVIHQVFPKAIIKTYTNLDELVKAIRANQINLVLDNDLVLKLLLTEHPELALRYKIIILRNKPDLICMAVSYDHPDLMHWLNIFIESKPLHYTTDDLVDYAMQQHQ